MSEEKKNEVLGQEKELSMDELDAVAGGGLCACPVAGGGTPDADQEACGCVMFGGGYNKSGGSRCFCVAGGAGSVDG